MKERINSLDGLKGLMCCVIAFGAHFWFPDTKLGDFLSNFYWFYARAVEVFCAISGFGMAIGYFDKIYTMNFSTYMKRKLTKLFPLYWLTLTISLVIYLMCYKSDCLDRMSDKSIDLYHTIFAYLGIECGWIIGASPVNGPTWTINCLILCYIVYYLVVKFSRNNKTIYIVSLVVLLLFSLTGIFNEWTYSFLNWDNTLRCLGSFCVGALIKEIYQNKKWSIRILIFEYVSILYLFILIFLFNLSKFDAMGNRASIAVIVFCPIAILSAIYIKPLKWMLETKLMQWLGDISMSLYMWHFIFIMVMLIYFPQVTNDWLLSVVFIVSQLFLTTIIHKFIEPKILPCIQKLLID